MNKEIMKNKLLLGLTLTVAVLGSRVGSVLAEAKPIIQSVADGHQFYGQVGSPSPVADLLRPVLPRIKRETKVPVLLPSKLPSELTRETKIYVSGRGEGSGYNIQLSSAPNCGANVCFIGYFNAKRGEKPSFDEEVPLAKGIVGYYKPLSCGGSCSPPALQWVSQGVLYSIQMRVTRNPTEAKATMIQLANSAIEAGAR